MTLYVDVNIVAESLVRAAWRRARVAVAAAERAERLRREKEAADRNRRRIAPTGTTTTPSAYKPDEPVAHPAAKNILDLGYMGTLAIEDGAFNIIRTLKLYTQNGQTSASIQVGPVLGSEPPNVYSRVVTTNGVPSEWDGPYSSTVNGPINNGIVQCNIGDPDPITGSYTHTEKVTQPRTWYKITALPIRGKRFICHIEFANSLGITDVAYSWGFSAATCEANVLVVQGETFTDNVRERYDYTGFTYSRTALETAKARGAITFVVTPSTIRQITAPTGFAALIRAAVPENRYSITTLTSEWTRDYSNDNIRWVEIIPGIVGSNQIVSDTAETQITLTHDYLTAGGWPGIRGNEPLYTYGMPLSEQGDTGDGVSTHTAGIYSDLNVILDGGFNPFAQPNFAPEGTPAYFPSAPAPIRGLAIKDEVGGAVEIDVLIPADPPGTYTREPSRIAAITLPSIPQDELNRVDHHFVWDWGKPSYCRAQLLALGFSPADLTP